MPKPKDSKKGEVIDPFLKIEIHGIASDKQEQKSSVIKNNGELRVHCDYKSSSNLEIIDKILTDFYVGFALLLVSDL